MYSVHIFPRSALVMYYVLTQWFLCFDPNPQISITGFIRLQGVSLMSRYIQYATRKL